jgi:hypothetical protein
MEVVKCEDTNFPVISDSTSSLCQLRRVAQHRRRLASKSNHTQPIDHLWRDRITIPIFALGDNAVSRVLLLLSATCNDVDFETVSSLMKFGRVSPAAQSCSHLVFEPLSIVVTVSVVWWAFVCLAVWIVITHDFAPMLIGEGS